LYTLGIAGWLSMMAIPLFLFYSLLALTLSFSVFIINRSVNSFRLNITSLPLIGYTSLAWLTSVGLLLLTSILNYEFTQYSGDTILKLYPITQQVVGAFIFYLLCKSCLVKKTGQPELSSSKRHLLSAGIAVIPTAIFVFGGSIWHLLR
jgi:hypothetical protein